MTNREAFEEKAVVAKTPSGATFVRYWVVGAKHERDGVLLGS
jgi:hypothetical protein